ncbi:MAG: hypothetical protein C0480_01180 [Bradyrhizobium sp.]|nr:hypothetical protein [Bradyrhizobium sp.]
MIKRSNTAAPRPGPNRSRTHVIVVDQAMPCRRHFDHAFQRGREDREATYRMTVVCPSAPMLMDFAMIERRPKGPAIVCPNYDDRDEKPTLLSRSEGEVRPQAPVEPITMTGATTNRGSNQMR